MPPPRVLVMQFFRFRVNDSAGARVWQALPGDYGAAQETSKVLSCLLGTSVIISSFVLAFATLLFAAECRLINEASLGQ